MAIEESNVHIVSWPKEPAKLEHNFKLDEPVPVSISFDESPANVIIETSPEKPFNVDMKMSVTAKDTIPVCIKICEPICVDSNYSIGIKVFDRPVSVITVRGRTRLFNCQEQPAPQRICVDFNELKAGTIFEEPFTHQELKFSPLGQQIRAATIGEPAGQVKLAFPKEGLRIDFNEQVSNIQVTVNNYAEPKLDFLVYSGSSLSNQFTVEVNNEVKVVSIEQSGVTAIEIKGGNNESSVVEVCYYPAYLELLNIKDRPPINRG
jgi:hypothetical protein